MDIESELKNFLNQLCVDLGFCLSPPDVQDIISKKSLSADSFTRLVFKAEGMDPEMELSLFRQVKRRFSDRFGNEISVEI